MKQHKDLCILSWTHYEDGSEDVRCIVLSNAYWLESAEIDESVLSGLIGALSEEVVFGHQLGQIATLCKNGNHAPYRVVPIIIEYSHVEGAAFVNIRKITLLDQHDIRVAIDAILKGRR